VQQMIDRATLIIDLMADDSWAEGCAPLMPTYRKRIQHKREATRWAEEVKIAAQQRAAKEQCHIAVEQQQAKAKREQMKQQKAEKQDHDHAHTRAKRETDSQQLSLTSSCAVVQRKSASSIGCSESGSEIAPS
jgi:hypothetical protein